MNDLSSHDFPLEPAPGLSVERVRWVKHWNAHLFSFALSRPSSFRFRSGEFVMIGLPGLDAAGFDEGSNAKPGGYVIERAFVD